MKKWKQPKCQIIIDNLAASEGKLQICEMTINLKEKKSHLKKLYRIASSQWGLAVPNNYVRHVLLSQKSSYFSVYLLPKMLHIIHCTENISIQNG